MSVAPEDLDAQLPIPRDALVGDVVSAVVLAGTWEIDVEIDAPRDQAARQVFDALAATGLVTTRDPHTSGQFFAAELTVDFIVGAGDNATPVHYMIRAR
ncbi:hypothetical protein [Nocardioides stalactiti]|uniref:hypothetical protein n=1 Tax=Nocardioides stalactiti TaxID=2755356 RepID=UPI001603839D|nr:hypothetical protein [Nocardioides stalactiti]